MKKMYISGMITGLKPTCVKRKFKRTEEFLRDSGFMPINPSMNKLADDASWKDYMLHDIEQLFTCDSIYMQRDWEISKGARIEKSIAEETGLRIFHEEFFNNDMREYKRISDVVEDVTGVTFDNIASKKKDQTNCLARYIFVYQCVTVEKMGALNIAKLINRRPEMVKINHLMCYESEYLINEQFRKDADKVDEILNKI